MSIYVVTVLYIHKDGRDVEACAVIGAPNAPEAIEAACEAVRAFPHCARIEGGVCEPLDVETASNARADNVVPLRPRGATVH